MSVDFNGEQQPLSPDTNIEAILKKNNILKFDGIAVAVNQHVIPFNQWKKKVLQNGDKILVIHATQGG